MDRQDKIKLMVAGKYATKYASKSKRSMVCHSCHQVVQRYGRKNQYYVFCDGCTRKYFLRPSGTWVSGIDRTREIVRMRDGHTCQKCKRVWVYGERRFDIHHINGCGRLTYKYDRVGDITEMVTLCHKCHIGLESVRRKISTRTGSVKVYSPNKYVILARSKGRL